MGGRRIALAMAAPALFCLPSAGSGQIAGGYDKPASKVHGAVDAHSFACFLGASGNPVAGVNLNAPNLMGQSLRVEKKATPWLAEAMDIRLGSNLASLETPEGRVWIVFERQTRACTVALQTEDPVAFRAKFLASLYLKDWKRIEDQAAAGFHYELELGDRLYVVTFPVSRKSGIFAVETRVIWH